MFKNILLAIIIAFLYSLFMEKYINYNYRRANYNNTKNIFMFFISIVNIILVIMAYKVGLISAGYSAISYGIIIGSIILGLQNSLIYWNEYTNNDKMAIVGSSMACIIAYIIYRNYASKWEKLENLLIEQKVKKLIRDGKIKTSANVRII